MKKFNLFAIGVVAMLMAAVNVSAADKAQGATEKYSTLALCLADEDTCTLLADETFPTTVTKDITIVTNGHKLTVNAAASVTNATATVKGGNLVISANVTLDNYGNLVVTDTTDKDTNAVLFDTASVTVTVSNTSRFEVSNNQGRAGIVVLPAATGSGVTLTAHSSFVVSNNRGNALNGGENFTIDAKDSTVESKNNTASGLSAIFKLDNKATVTATGNGLSGVSIAYGSTIANGTTITATGNMKNPDEQGYADKADIILKGDGTGSSAIDIQGNLVGGSLALEKATWKTGKPVPTTKVTVKGNGVNVSELKAVCAGDKNCGELAVAPEFTVDDSAAIKVGKTVTVYGTNDKELTFDATVEEVVIDEDATVSRISVAPGTAITNNSSSAVLAHVTGEDTLVEVPAATTEGDKLVPGTKTLGTKPAEEQKPGEEQNPGEEQKPGTTTPDDDAKNPDTLDNVTSVAAMGGISLAIAAAGIVTLKKREN